VLHLVRDVLDKQLVDREGRPFGKVDGIVLEVRDGAAPRVIALEVGAATRLGRLPRGLTRWLGRWSAHATSTRLPQASVVAVGREIYVAVDATQTAAWRVEAWLARLITRLPGGG